MFRTLTVKMLTLIFVGLLVLTVSVKLIDGARGVNTLQAVLFDINADAVREIHIQPKMLGGDTIVLLKAGAQWQVKHKDKLYKGDAQLADNLLKQLNRLKPRRLASRSRDQWGKYELSDSLASCVRFMGADKELARLYIGKFSYQQPRQAMTQQAYYQRPQGIMTTYVRNGDQEEVYAVEGFLGSSVNRDVEAFRDKNLLRLNKELAQKISFKYPADSSFTMVKNENTWMVDGLALDSARVADYLADLSRQRVSSFAETMGGAPSHTLTIQSGDELVELTARMQDEAVRLSSSQNEGTIFSDTDQSHFNKLFISKQQLMP